MILEITKLGEEVLRKKAEPVAEVNDEIKKLGEEKFFHADYDATLKAVYGDDANPDSMVVEGGVVD